MAPQSALTLLSHDIVTCGLRLRLRGEEQPARCVVRSLHSACTYGAIDFRDITGQKGLGQPVRKGDGVCTAKCPTNAIFLKHFTDEELLSQIDAAFPEAEITH